VKKIQQIVRLTNATGRVSEIIIHGPCTVCLNVQHSLLPPKRGRSNRHRPKRHDYELPNCKYNFYKQSYVIKLSLQVFVLIPYCMHTVLCVYVCYMLLINTLTLTLTLIR